jgi:hypothetical protein
MTYRVLFVLCVSDGSLTCVINSFSDPQYICIQLASWIRIRIRNGNPDPGGVKLAKVEGKTGAKRKKIHHKSYHSV